MLIQWESPKFVASGSAANGFHDEDGKLHVVYLPHGSGQPTMISAYVEGGLWDNIQFGNPTAIAPDTDVVDINMYHFHESNTWLVWESEKAHRFAVTPDDGDIYDPESMYRLYYAVDTEKLYMNISETWEFIGSPRIENLVGYEDLVESMSELNSKLAGVVERLGSVEGNVEESLEAFATELGTISTGISSVTSGLESLSGTVSDLDTRVAGIDARLIEVEENGGGTPGTDPSIPESFVDIIRDHNGSDVSVLNSGTKVFASQYVNNVADPNSFIYKISVWLKANNNGTSCIVHLCEDTDGNPDLEKIVYSSNEIYLTTAMQKYTVDSVVLTKLEPGKTYWVLTDARNQSIVGDITQGTTNAGIANMRYNPPGWSTISYKLAYELNIVSNPAVVDELEERLVTIETDIVDLDARVDVIEDGVPTPGPGTGPTLDTKVKYKVLLVSDGITGDDVAGIDNAIAGYGHTVTRVITADMGTVTISNFDAVVFRYYTGTPANNAIVKGWYDLGVPLVLGFQADNTTESIASTFGIASNILSENSNAMDIYVSMNYSVVTAGLYTGAPVRMSNSPNWHANIMAPYIGTPLLFDDTQGTKVTSLVVEPGTVNTKGETLPRSVAFCGLVYGRGGLPYYGANHIDRLIRYMVQIG